MGGGVNTPPDCDWHRLHPIIANIPKIFQGLFFGTPPISLITCSDWLFGCTAAVNTPVTACVCVFAHVQIKSNYLQRWWMASLNYSVACDFYDLHSCLAVKRRLTWEFSWLISAAAYELWWRWSGIFGTTAFSPAVIRGRLCTSGRGKSEKIQFCDGLRLKSLRKLAQWKWVRRSMRRVHSMASAAL